MLFFINISKESRKKIFIRLRKLLFYRQIFTLISDDYLDPNKSTVNRDNKSFITKEYYCINISCNYKSNTHIPYIPQERSANCKFIFP